MKYQSASAFLFIASLAMAQNNRTLQAVTPVVVGQTAAFSLTYPTAAAANVYVFAFSAPHYPGVQSLQIPGFTVQGLMRIDPSNFHELFAGALDASGHLTRSFVLPDAPILVGFTFDLQSLDLALSNATITFSDNELMLTIADVMPNMQPIAAGTFAMGSGVSPLNVAPYFNQADALPVHQVTITQPFWIGRYEVTQAEYQAVMGNNPSNFVGPQRPVEQVTWNDAMAYCAALTLSEGAAGRVPLGYQYRLPTEAEWEYCCRAGTTTEYSVGATLSCAQANHAQNHHTGQNCSIGTTANVGSYTANAWGLHDLMGNVREWCLDSWDGAPNYPTAGVSDPYGTSGNTNRVIRGGSWIHESFRARSAWRRSSHPSDALAINGFRVVLAPALVP